MGPERWQSAELRYRHAVMLTIRRTVADAVRICAGAAQRAESGRWQRCGRLPISQIVGNVRAVETWADQQVGAAVQGTVRQRCLARRLVQGAISVHFAIYFEIRQPLVQQRQYGAHFERRRRFAAAEMECDSNAALVSGRNAHSCSGGQLGYFRQLLGAGIEIDVRVHDEYLTAG